MSRSMCTIKFEQVKIKKPAIAGFFIKSGFKIYFSDFVPEGLFYPELDL